MANERRCYLDGGSGTNTADYSAAPVGRGSPARPRPSDTLVGDGGNNTLYGNGGSDRYGFGRGGGQDIIVNRLASNRGATGELDLGARIATDQLWFLRDRHYGHQRSRHPGGLV